MNLFEGVYTWNILQWIILIIIFIFIILWLSGNSKLVNYEDRILRYEPFDEYYEYPGGFILMHVRNVLFLVFLFILFKVLSF